MLRRIRIPVQLAALALFLYLLARTIGVGEDRLGPPVRIFLEADPLIGVTTWLRTGALHGLLPLSLVTLALAFALGRSFCGWICPLGTLGQVAGRLGHPRRAERTPERSRPDQLWKYALLLFVLGGAAGGALWTGVLDPICLLIRGLSVGIVPPFDAAIRAAAADLASTPLAPVTEPVWRWVRDGVLAPRSPHPQQGLLLAAVLLGVLALSWVRRRFWCRVLCPLGGLLGVAALGGTLRLRQSPERCTDCGLCAYHCQGAADPDRPGSWKASECLVCGNCTAACRRGGLAFTFEPPHAARWAHGAVRWLRRGRKREAEVDAATAADRPPFPASARTPMPTLTPERAPAPAPELATTDLTRRGLLASLVLGAFAASLSAAGPAFSRPSGSIIRPPGAPPEAEFLDRCIRCAECIKVCPQNGLHPEGWESGLAGLWTPLLRPRLGYCEYHCTLCGQVCPTGAIRRLEPQEKETTIIGLAWVDSDRCLPYAAATPCIVCEEHCPTSPKAIRLEEATAVSATGTERAVRRPRIDPAKCVGCGICEYVCPVEGAAGIRIEGTGRVAETGAMEGGYGA